MQPLDAVLGVEAIQAHVPFVHGTCAAGLRVARPDDADDQVTRGESTVWRRLEDTADRLVPEDEALLAGRRLAVRRGNDLHVGAADAHTHDLDEQVAVGSARLREVDHLGGVGHAGSYGQRAHVAIIGYPRARGICRRGSICVTSEGACVIALACSDVGGGSQQVIWHSP